MIVHHGQCSNTPAGPNSVFVPLLDAGSDAAYHFEADSVNFTRTSCTDGFNELPASGQWTEALCVSASADVCLSGAGPELIRITAEFSGASTKSLSLYVDDKPAAWAQQQDWKVAGIYSGYQTVDTVLLLSGRCHKVAIVYDDGVTKELDGDDANSHRNKVRFQDT